MKGVSVIKFDGYKSINSFLNIDVKSDVEVHNQRVDKTKRHCLFCGKEFPDAKFSEVAQAISETLGNKSIFTHFECNACNAAFGEFLEDSLGKYILPFKILS